MLDFLLLVSRTGKLRLSKYYQDVSERDILQREVSALVLNRPARMCNFLECRGHKIVYKRCVIPRELTMLPLCHSQVPAVALRCSPMACPRCAHLPGMRACTLWWV